MNKAVNPIVATLAIFFTVSLFGLKYWFDQQSLELPRPSLIQPHPQGGVVILAGLTLYHVGEAEQLVSTVDLRALGITDMVGDFAFFANGDLLIRTDSVRATSESDFSAFLRTENQSYQPGSGANTLSRCILAGSSCSVFSKEIPALNRTFRLHINWLDDTVYLADTSRNRVIAFSDQGILLSAQDGFKFPNQLRLYDETLWVADTNHHSVRRLSIRPKSFGQELESHPTKAGGDWIWPSAFLQVGENWWVDVMTNDMKDGKIIVFDRDWKRKYQLTLPYKADPLAVEMLGKRVLVSDMENIAIYQYNQEGVRMPDLDVPGFSDYLSSVREEARCLDGMSWLVLGVFGLSLAIGFFVAVRMQNKTEEGGEEQAALSGKEAVGSTDTKPHNLIPPEGTAYEINKRLRTASTVGLPLLLIGQIPFIYMLKDHPETMAEIGIPLFLMNLGFIALWMPVRRLVNYQVRIYPHKILVTDHYGQRREAAYEKLAWSKTSVLVKDMVIQTANPRGQEFYKGLGDALKPMLIPANKISDRAMGRHRWSSPDGLLKSVLVTIVFMIAAIVYMEREMLLAWLENLG
ncbi:MAG: hypothetical protein KUG71_14745 [Porticoccaceae bacterium]|nr:hypothetical protein [Porticoccaceae bacterium]